MLRPIVPRRSWLLPRSVRDIEGFQRLELLGCDGRDDYGGIEEVPYLERDGRLLVAPDEAA